MFGLMRKLISKPFADTPEKRDQMDKLVCDMVDGIPMQPTEAIYLDSVTGPKTIKGEVNFGDYPPIDCCDVGKPEGKPRLRIESDGSYGNAIVRMAYERLISSYDEVKYSKSLLNIISIEGKTRLSENDGADDCHSNGANHGYIKTMSLMIDLAGGGHYGCLIRVGRKHSESVYSNDKKLMSEIQEKADQKDKEIQYKRNSDFMNALLSAGDAK